MFAAEVVQRAKLSECGACEEKKKRECKVSRVAHFKQLIRVHTLVSSLLVIRLPGCMLVVDCADEVDGGGGCCGCGIQLYCRISSGTFIRSFSIHWWVKVSKQCKHVTTESPLNKLRAPVRQTKEH